MLFRMTLFCFTVLLQSFAAIAVVCPLLFNPENGIVVTSNGNMENSIARYLCDFGYIAELSNRVCTNGQWSGEQPQCIVGVPPRFVVEPMDTVVHSSIIYSIGGLNVNLILNCNAIGHPTPTITWYREDVEVTNGRIMDDGSLVLDVIEGEDATRSGLRYHCEATNIIGRDGTIPATIRSRDANVTYAFFAGFRSFTSVQVEVKVALGGSVALECDLLPSNPSPQIQWRDSDFESLDNTTLSKIYFLNDGKFLYMTALDEDRLERQYFCSAIDLTGNKIESFIKYTLADDLLPGNLVEYKQIGNLSGTPGEFIRLVYAAGYKKSNPFGFNGVTLGCNNPRITFVNVGGGIIYFEVPPPEGNSTELTITCTRLTADGSIPSVTTHLIILEPAQITIPPSNTTEIMDRESYQGQVAIKVFTCLAEGNPEPTLSWYYNGDPITGVSGIIENKTHLIISSLQTTHNGIYQCLVKNRFNGVSHVDQRTWILEVRIPRPTYIEPLLTTNPLAVADEFLGILLVAPNNTSNLVLTAVVSIDPCASVQWIFNGTNIPSNHFLVNFSNPCTDDAFPPYTYNLTIPPSTLFNNPGFYSAEFDNGGSEPIILPKVFVTLPVAAQIINLTVIVENEPYATCLVIDSNVIFDCESTGYPRPTVNFIKNKNLILTSESFGIIRIGTHQLKISGITLRDGGLYSCEALPDGVELIKNFLTCTKPVITTITATDITTTELEGNFLQLVCVTNGTPTPTIIWTKDGIVLDNQDNVIIYPGENGRHAITIVSAIDDLYGMYTCSASNSAGVVNLTKIIEIVMTPSVLPQTSKLSVGVIAGIAISCMAIVAIIVLIINAAYVVYRRINKKMKVFVGSIEDEAKITKYEAISDEATEQETTEQETTKWKATERVATERETTEREATEWGATEQEPTREAREMETTEWGATKWEPTEREARERKTTERETKEWESTERETVEWETTEEGTTEEETTEEETTEEETSEWETTEEETTEGETTEEETTEGETTEEETTRGKSRRETIREY